MHKFLHRMNLILASLLLVLSSNSSAQSASAVYSKVTNSVGIVLVSTFEGQLVASGSGVVVADQTMVTNRHVLLPGHRYMVLIDNTRREAFMTSCDPVQDLCLLSVPKLEAKPVEFADASKLAVGDTVYAIGAPLEIGMMRGVAAVTKQKTASPAQLTLSNGMITVLRPVEDGNIIQTNAAISHGSSGGGLFDQNGRLAGITTFGVDAGQNLNLALPVNWVARLGVNGAPKTATASTPTIDSNASNSAPPAPTVGQSPQETPINSPTVSQEQPAAVPAATSESLYNPKAWWAGIPILFIAWYIIRRKNSLDSEGDDEPPIIIASSPGSTNPLAQQCYAQAKKEFDEKQIDEKLWHRLLMENNSDETAARSSYIKQRANRLLSIEKDKQWAQAAQQTQTQN